MATHFIVFGGVLIYLDFAFLSGSGIGYKPHGKKKKKNPEIRGLSPYPTRRIRPPPWSETRYLVTDPRIKNEFEYA